MDTRRGYPRTCDAEPDALSPQPNTPASKPAPDAALVGLAGLDCHRFTTATTERFVVTPDVAHAEAERGDHAAIQLALRAGDFEEAAARYLSASSRLGDHDRLPEAIGVLDEAVYVLRRSCEGSTTRAGRLLWPLLAMLARHLDAFGDRPRARRIAAQAEREAVRGESRFGRDATRVLLRHPAQRRGSHD